MIDTSMTNSNLDMLETPGQVLRLQREKLNISMQEIARQIYLDVKIIEAIEKDNSNTILSAMYVRGYLRSYAKIVGIDADKIIELYNADYPPAAPEILPEVRPPSQASSNDKPVKAFTYLITLGLVLLLLISYQNNFIVDNKIENGQLNTETSINGIDIRYKIVNHPDSWQSPVNNLAEEINDSKNVEPSEQKSIDGLQLFDEQTNTTPLKITDDKLPSTVAEHESDTINSNTCPVGVATHSTVTGHQSDTIEMNVTADSWVEIRDAVNNCVFYDLAVAGKNYNLGGSAPFSVLLGFSKGVSIKFNGKPFDIESYSKYGVARFTLSE